MVSLPRVSRRHVTERYPLFSTVVSLSLDGRRRSPPFLPPPPLFLSATDIARSERVRRIHNNRRIQSCSTYREEWVKISSEPIAIDCDLHRETRREIIVARFFFLFLLLTRHTPGGYIPPSLPPSITLHDSANSILYSSSLFLLLSVTIYYVYFTRYIVTRYRLLSLLLRLL